MSLKAFHIFFILISILTLAGFGGWALKNFQAAGPLTAGLGALALAGAAGLAAYLAWFIRKSRNMP